MVSLFSGILLFISANSVASNRAIIDDGTTSSSKSHDYPGLDLITVLSSSTNINKNAIVSSGTVIAREGRRREWSYGLYVGSNTSSTAALLSSDKSHPLRGRLYNPPENACGKAFNITTSDQRLIIQLDYLDPESSTSGSNDSKLCNFQKQFQLLRNALGNSKGLLPLAIVFSRFHFNTKKYLAPSTHMPPTVGDNANPIPQRLYEFFETTFDEKTFGNLVLFRPSPVSRFDAGRLPFLPSSDDDDPPEDGTIVTVLLLGALIFIFFLLKSRYNM